jgi:glycosyltransferase involved in cell wall biosynthesis
MVANGWDGDKTSMRTPPVEAKRKFDGAMASDVVVFHRPAQYAMLEAAKLLKKAGKKIVFDNDDTYIKNSGVPKQMFGVEERVIDERIQEIDDLLKQFASIADLVTVTTPFLAKEYESVNPNIKILPNFVEPYDWDDEILRNEGDKVRIGMVGSVAANRDYDSVKNILKKLSRRKDIQLVLFALPPDKEGYALARKVYAPEIKFWDKMNVEWQHFVPMADYIETLNSLRLDLMLIPRRDNYFNRCKSNIKFLEASMLEIPVIAQGFSDGNSPYEADKDFLKLAITEKDWEKYIAELVDNKALRREMGKRARDYVIDTYNINDHAHKWREAYQELNK